MTPIVYGYTKCTTVKKGLKFLKDEGYDFEHIDNVENKLTKEEIQSLFERSEFDIKKFFNTSGMKYRELGLKDKLVDMTLDQKLELLATDGMLVKRPILVTDKGVFPSFKAEKWLELM